MIHYLLVKQALFELGKDCSIIISLLYVKNMFDSLLSLINPIHIVTNRYPVKVSSNYHRIIHSRTYMPLCSVFGCTARSKYIVDYLYLNDNRFAGHLRNDNSYCSACFHEYVGYYDDFCYPNLSFLVDMLNNR